MKVLFQDITHSWGAPVIELDARENGNKLEIYYNEADAPYGWQFWGWLDDPFNTNETMTVREAVAAGAKIVLRGSAVEMLLV